MPHGMTSPVTAYAEFMHHTQNGRWSIAEPKMPADKELIESNAA